MVSGIFLIYKTVDFGYDLTIFPALATPEYQIYSGDKIQGGIGDNLARSAQWIMDHLDTGLLAKVLGPDSLQNLTNKTARFGWLR